MDARHEVTPDGPHIAAALAGLVAENVALMRGEALAGRAWPALYASGVRYQREAPGRERWLNVEQLMRARRGDCEDLASARAAELRVRGENARAVAYRSNPTTWHCVVRRGDGTLEDPSRKLGMGGRMRACLGYSVRPEGDGYRATVRLRRRDGRTIGFSIFRRIARGVSKAVKKIAKSKLLRGAIALARKALSSPFLQSLLPPQVALALRAASALAKAARKGTQMARIAAQLQEGGLSQLARLATHVSPS